MFYPSLDIDTECGTCAVLNKLKSNKFCLTKIYLNISTELHSVINIGVLLGYSMSNEFLSESPDNV